MNRLFLKMNMNNNTLILLEGVNSKRVYPDTNNIYLACMNYGDILEMVEAVPEFTIVQPWPPHNKINIEQQRKWENRTKFFLLLVPKTSDSNSTLHMKYSISHERGLPRLRHKDYN